MLHDHLETPTSVDAKTAEEALALALRLQQERGDRVSVEELQRTADEAGIDRVYLESALRQVAHKEVHETQVMVPQRRRIMVMATAMAIAVLIAMVGKGAPEAFDSPFFIFALIFGMLGARFAIKRSSDCSGRRRRFGNWF